MPVNEDQLLNDTFTKPGSTPWTDSEKNDTKEWLGTGVRKGELFSVAHKKGITVPQDKEDVLHDYLAGPIDKDIDKFDPEHKPRAKAFWKGYVAQRFGYFCSGRRKELDNIGRIDVVISIYDPDSGEHIIVEFEDESLLPPDVKLEIEEIVKGLPAFRRSLEECLASLPDRKRKVVIKRFFEGKSHQQIAVELGITEETSRQVHRRFFEGKSHQKIAVELGITEETSRKILERSLKLLRECLNRKGYTGDSIGEYFELIGALIAKQGGLVVRGERISVTVQATTEEDREDEDREEHHEGGDGAGGADNEQEQQSNQT